MTDPIGKLLAHERWLRPLVRSLVHGDEVDDVLQETWLAAIEGGPRAGSARGWLATVARNFARIRRRTSMRRERREALVGECEPQRSTLETVEKLALQGELARALAELQEPFREAVVLRYHDGLSYDEIAKLQGIAVDNARQRVKRGLERLRHRLQGSRGPDWRAGFAAIALGEPGRVAVPVTAKTLGVGAWIMSHSIRIAIAASIVVAAIFTIDAVRSVEPGAPRAPGPLPAAVASSSESPQKTAAPSLERQRVAANEPGSGVPESEQPAHTGSVLDVLGRPLVGVRVLAILADEVSADAVRERALPEDPWQLAQPVAVTGQDGRFEIDSSQSIALIIVDEPYAMVRRPAESTVKHREQRMLFVATPSGGLSGIVSSATGELLSNVRIAVDAPPLSSFPEPLDATLPMRYPDRETAANGTFTLARLPANHCTVTFSKPGYRSRTVDIVPGPVTGASVVLEPVLDARCALFGTVLGARGSIVAGALVAVGDVATRSDSRGRYRLVFDRAVLAAGDPLVAAAPGRQTFVNDEPAALFTGSSEVRFDFDLSREALQLDGRVVDGEGRGVAGIHVRLWNEPVLHGDDTGADLALEGLVERCTQEVAQPRAHAVTDATGAFRIGGLQDKQYELRCRQPGTFLAWTVGPFAGGRTGLEIAAPLERVLPQVDGRVVDRAGSPIADVEVLYNVCVHNAPGHNSWSGPENSQRTDRAGRFRFERVPAADDVLFVAVGDDILVEQYRVQPSQLAGEVVVTVDRLCRFRVETSSGRAAFVTLRDVDDRPVDIWERRGRTRTSWLRFPVTDRSTPILSASERASQVLVLDRDLTELARLPIRLLVGETVVVR